MSRASRFARVLAQQATLRGQREIERPQPDQDAEWLAANDKPSTRPPGRAEHCVKASQQSREP
jgi:hypothetical protein